MYITEIQNYVYVYIYIYKIFDFLMYIHSYTYAKKLILRVADFLFSNENMCCVSAVFQAVCQSLDSF